jgi:hypothetical protein
VWPAYGLLQRIFPSGRCFFRNPFDLFAGGCLLPAKVLNGGNMRRLLVLLMMLTLVGSALAKTRHKPYLLFGKVDGNLGAVAEKLEEGLAASGFEILGRYSPARDASNAVICMTHPELRSAADQVGGYGLFALGFRVGLREVGGQIEVSSMNPPYWGHAYFQKRYKRVASKMKAFEASLRSGIAKGLFTGPEGSRVTPIVPTGFGHRRGLTEKKLMKYHYMVFMPYLKDSVTLASGKDYSYEKAVATIERNLADGLDGAQKVYRIDDAEHGATLFGVGLGNREVGEPHFVPIIDIGEPRHIPFLPYEILVTKKKAFCLHGRFRIALSFPSLTMTTFTKIMSTPGAISDAMSKIANTQPAPKNGE